MAKRISDDDGLRRHERQILERGGSLGPRLVEPAWAECYFCDATGIQQSQEHIFASWLQQELGIEGEVFEPTYMFAGHRQRRGSIPAPNLVSSSGICAPCNNGWMSQVETGFQPYFRERRRDVPVVPIARWFLKTAFVLNVTQNTRLLVPRQARLELAAGGIPRDVGLYFHRVKKTERKGRIDWVQAGGCLAPGEVPRTENRGDYDASMERLWSCSIRIDDIVGTVVSNPAGEVYRPSWEAPGFIAVESGEVVDRVGWSHLPHVRVLGNAPYVLPYEVSWADAAVYRDRALPFPDGIEGPEEIEALKVALLERMSGPETRVVATRRSFNRATRPTRDAD